MRKSDLCWLRKCIQNICYIGNELYGFTIITTQNHENLKILFIVAIDISDKE